MGAAIGAIGALLLSDKAEYDKGNEKNLKLFVTLIKVRVPKS